MVSHIVIATVCLENVYAARRPLRQSSSKLSDIWMYVAKQLMRAWDPVMELVTTTCDISRRCPAQGPHTYLYDAASNSQRCVLDEIYWFFKRPGP
jgi:hypothetical protein